MKRRTQKGMSAQRGGSRRWGEARSQKKGEQSAVRGAVDSPE